MSEDDKQKLKERHKNRIRGMAQKGLQQGYEHLIGNLKELLKGLKS